MRASQSAEKTRKEVEALDALDFQTLKQRYHAITGESPPKRIGRKLLLLAVAYEIQRKDHRRLVDRVHRRLESFDKKDGEPAQQKRTLKSGGRLVREWRGKTYEVHVAADGVYWNGQRYKSLSAAAFAITGAKWNGPRFFGLRSSKADL